MGKLADRGPRPRTREVIEPIDRQEFETVFIGSTVGLDSVPGRNANGDRERPRLSVGPCPCAVYGRVRASDPCALSRGRNGSPGFEKSQLTVGRRSGEVSAKANTYGSGRGPVRAGGIVSVTNPGGWVLREIAGRGAFDGAGGRATVASGRVRVITLFGAFFQSVAADRRTRAWCSRAVVARLFLACRRAPVAVGRIVAALITGFCPCDDSIAT